MKRPFAFTIFAIAAGLGRPAWGQDYPDGLIPAPYASELSASRFRTRSPSAPSGPANSYGGKLYPYSDTSPSEDETALDPYATDATGAPTANDRYGANNGRGTAYPNIPSFASNPYARLTKPYANQSGGIPSAPGARGTYDQNGNYDDGLTTYPDDPRSASNPYDPYGENRFANAYGGYDNPYDDQPIRNLYGADLRRSYDLYGYHMEGLTSNPYDYDSASNPYSTINPYAGNEYRDRGAPAARPRSATAPKIDDHSRDHGSGSNSNQFDAKDMLKSDQSTTDSRAANAPNLQDQTGDHNLGLTSVPADPGALSKPSSRGDAPDLNLSATSPRPASASNLDNPIRDHDPGSASNPHKPHALPNPFPGGGALSDNQSAANPNGVTTPKSNIQKGVYSAGASSKPSANPVERGVHPSMPDGLGTSPGSANPNSPSLSPKL